MKAKPLFVPALALAALACAILAPQPSSGQAAAGPATAPAARIPAAAPAAEEDPALAALAAELAAQQAVILDNQTKIEAKLATIAENVRVARIFASRGGGKAK